MSDLPRDRLPDSTVLLLAEGYDFLPRRFRTYGGDAFETKLLGEQVTCVRGPDAVRLLDDADLFERHGAAPSRVPKTLFGVGGVQGLDGEDHRHRKAMLMSLMAPDARAELSARTAELWRESLRQWSDGRTVRLHDAVGELLCRAVCDWTGVPLPDGQVHYRAHQMRRMIEAPATVGPAYWRGRAARSAADEWMASLVSQVRLGVLDAPADRARPTTPCRPRTSSR